jgi:inosine/xanthosine triphosphate pyrophosphatase family protein
MKITVIKKASNAKPMMACPMIIDDSALAKR